MSFGGWNVDMGVEIEAIGVYTVMVMVVWRMIMEMQMVSYMQPSAIKEMFCSCLFLFFSFFSSSSVIWVAIKMALICLLCIWLLAKGAVVISLLLH